jgi:hypothetical protein
MTQSETEQISKLLNLAREFISIGNLTSAVLVCQSILDIEPRNFGALNIVAKITANLGLQLHIADPPEILLPSSKDSPSGVETSRSSPSQTTEDAQHETKYLVVKAWGRGFWSDVSHALACFLLAEISKRTPVTHWGDNSLFGNGSGSDAFSLYFEPVSDVSLDQISKNQNATYFPSHWSRINLMAPHLRRWAGGFPHIGPIFFLRRPESVLVSDFYIGVIDVIPWIPNGHPMHRKSVAETYRYLIGKYLRPRQSILMECDKFFEKHLKGSPIVAIHLRGSDKILEDPSSDLTNRTCLSAPADFGSTWRIFVLTDDERLLFKARSIYGDRVVATRCTRTATEAGVHTLSSTDRYRIGIEIMVDTYLALRAERFIGNGRSNVSAMIALLKEWKPEDCTLLAPSSLFDRFVSTADRGIVSLRSLLEG